MRRVWKGLLVAGAIGLSVVTGLAQDAAPKKGEAVAERLDQKRVGKRYRLKVASAGVPTLGGFLEGFSVRTQYRVLDKDGGLVGTGYLNDYVYVDGPGAYTIEVNGGRRQETFDIPPEMTRDRIEASWKRARAVELRPRNAKARLTVANVWVLHPPEVQGEHVDDFKVEPLDPKNGSGAVGQGVALVYPPEEIHDIDDGILFANTLVHLWPGTYRLTINGTQTSFELAEGESKLVRLGALICHDEKGDVVQLERGAGATPLTVPRGKWFVVAPGSYTLGAREHVEVAPGGVAALAHVKQAFDKPRLGVNAQDAKEGGAVVRGFAEGSPAAGAGVKVGDTIVALDGKPIAGTSDLVKALAEKKPGDEIEVSLRREGRAEPVTVKVKLGGS